MTIKEGDKVRVIKRSGGHEFEIGEIVVVENVGIDDYKCASDNDYWYLSDDEIELIEGDSNTTDATDAYYAAQAAKHAIKITVSIGDMVVIYDGTTAQ